MHPGAEEICGDLVDEDCDGEADSCPLSGILDAEGDADAILRADGAGEYAGGALALLGDGDGRGDGAVGAIGRGEAGAWAGGVYLVPAPLDGTRSMLDGGYFLAGQEIGDHVGASVAAGDVDGDGRDDLLLGAPGIDHGGVEGGGALLFRGRL